jgi:phosphoglycolate phosphatase
LLNSAENSGALRKIDKNAVKCKARFTKIMKKYDVIAFDLDGTLSNPERGLIESFVYTFKKEGIPFSSREELKRFIGPPIYEEWQRVLGLTPEQSSHALDVFHEYYSVYGWWDNVIYPGVEEMLGQLRARGKKIVLATSKPEVFARKIMDLFGLSKYFDFIGGAETDKIRDKKWEVLEYSLKSINADPEKSIMVGDRFFDAEGARIVGIDSLGVMYGHGTEEEINSSGFNYIAKTVEDIVRILG